MDVDALGLDELDRSLLRAIIEMYNGGPVGLETLAAALGEEDDPAGLGHADHGSLVVLVEQLFDGKHLGLCPLNDLDRKSVV